ncbi:MAG: DUF6493 family protein [Umezawaea sp.]
MSLAELVRAGDVAGVLRELGTLTPEQREENQAALAACRAEIGTEWRGEYEPEMAAQLVAELGCQVSASDAADWFRAREHRCLLWGKGEGVVHMVDVVKLRPVEWRIELIGLLAEQVMSDHTFGFEYVEHLVHDTPGCPVPTSDAFLTAWVFERKHHCDYCRERPVVLTGEVPGDDFRERLLADPWTTRLLPVAVASPGVDLELADLALFSHLDATLVDRVELATRCFAAISANTPWGSPPLKVLGLTPAEHAQVVGPRVELLGRCLERLLQDGTRMELAPWLELVRVMAPTPAEHVGVARDLLALLDGSPPVVDYAQEVLAGLDEAGLIEPELVTEACERVLLRAEKKIVRAQLSWLDKVAKRDPARAGQVVTAASMGFDNRDSALQERALAVVARHLKPAGESVLPELRAAAERLGPGLSARAAELFGLSEDTATEQFTDVLPVVSEPRPVPGPLATVAEVAEEVAAVLAGDDDVVVFERALDGLVRHAHLDRAALAAALKPTVRREPRKVDDCRPSDLYDVARAVRDEEPRESAIGAVQSIWVFRIFSLAGKLLAARLLDAIDAVRSGTRPFLLAVPTLATGALDAAVLVERLAAYEELDIAPGLVDLAQALLRVTPTSDQRVLAAAGELGSDAGKWVADWLRTGGLPHQESQPSDWDPEQVPFPERWSPPAAPGVSIDLPLPQEVADLVGPYQKRKSDVMDAAHRFWFAQLPHHRDVVAARDYWGSWYRSKGWTAALPFMAESGGPAGFAVHAVLARSTGTSGPEDQGAVVDAVLVLAARGQLDAALLGRQIAVQVHHAYLPTNRLVETLRLLADTGAHGVVWSVFEGALPVLLHGELARGTGELLAVAVECASRCGASGEIPAVTAVADRKGSTQVVKNARALREVLQRV